MNYQSFSIITKLNLEVTGLRNFYNFRRGRLADIEHARGHGKLYCSGWPLGIAGCQGRRDDHNLLQGLPRRRTSYVK
jgi:hypothetical protein